jgi:hypothetical protein
LRIATRVSNSGGWMSALMPERNAGPEALLEVRDLLRRAIAREDHLPLGHEVLVGVEELFLGALLAGQELDVVDQEEVDRAVPLAELRGLVVADRGDQVVGELLARQVLDPEVRVARARR